MSLTSWQERLSRHFEALALSRAQRTALPAPVFALEHGLEPVDLQALTLALRAHVAKGPPATSHDLAWIVYAAELGYRYSGDEYWQTFEAETPGWTTHGDRYWIRDRFRSFHKKFRGAVPSGPWAEHFSIICWPITHAILPRDLQQQLARILYELRHSFSAELFESPLLLGEFIAARSWNATSRFQHLAEDTQLVGQIAAALLLQGTLGTDTLIHPATLRRIGEDLDHERRGREWLIGARRFAQERASIRGLAIGRSVTSFGTHRVEDVRAEVTALGLEPRLVLRPRDTTGASWELSLEIPDLSQLMLRFPRSRDVLTSSRCIVAGAAGRPLARGRCLHGTQRVALSRWPQASEVLLQFEQAEPQLEFLLRTECLLRPGPMWLFKVGSDCLAYESRSLRVRAGSRYVLVRAGKPFVSGSLARPVDIGCEGVHAAILELPAALSPEWEDALRDLGLTQAKTIEVWPAGLSAALWDGEGHGEWLASERPCLGVRSDYPIGALLVSLGVGTETSLEVSSVAPGEPIFIELPPLAVGLHRVRVAARSGTGHEAEEIGELDVVMRIREARAWSPGISPHGPLFVEMAPPAPTLEQLWEGRVDVTVGGPVGRAMKCRASLFDGSGETPILTRQLPAIGLPVTSEQWRLHFDKHLREVREAQARYDSARACELEFSADELGAFTVRCERESKPVRWALRRLAHDYELRLMEDVGNGGAPVVSRRSFERPTLEERLDVAKSVYKVPAVGGLYVARVGDFMASLIVPPAVRGLSDLRCEPRIDERERTVDAILLLIDLSRLWGTARLPGDLFSAKRQHDVLHALASQMFRMLGGDTWAAAEVEAQQRDDGIAELKRSVSRKREEAVIGAALAAECASLVSATHEARVERLAGLVGRVLLLPSRPPTRAVVATRSPSGVTVVRRTKVTGPDDASWLAELALRLASHPIDVQSWAGDHLRGGVTRLLELSTLARAARFLVLATNHHLHQGPAPGELYAGWRWT